MNPAERMRRCRLRKRGIVVEPVKRGRPLVGEKPMTSAERNRRWREKKRQQAEIRA